MSRNDVLYEARAGYTPRSAQEAFIVPLLHAGIMQALNRYIEPSHGLGRSAIDVGCGGQPFRSTIEKLGYAYISFDVQQNAAGNVDVLGMIDQALPAALITKGPFDLVFCTEVLEHVADWKTAFENFAQLLAPGGKLLVTCPHFYHLHEEPFDYWRPTPFALARYGVTAGLRVVHQERLGNAWDVLGTLLACARPRYVGRSFSGKFLAGVVDFVRRAAFLVLRTRLLHRMVPLDGTAYLSNLAVFEQPEDDRN